MTVAEAVAALRAANPYAPLGQIQVYADAWAEYRLAQANIAEHGSVVFHPRTGAPVPNPYLSIRDKAGAIIGRSKLKADDLWPQP